MEAFLEFEKPIATLEKKLNDLRELSKTEGMDLSEEIAALEKKLTALIASTYSSLTPWQRVMLSRHPNRPYTRDYIDALFPDFLELHGDRAFGDDPAIIAGVASWPPQQLAGEVCELRPETSVLIIGHQKGRTTKQKMQRNFGMARPEGYRKAIRLMEMANRARMPIITFIDTPGAYPSVDAEERGQSQAIAESIRYMFGVNVPILAVVIGEGGSGGALAIGVANKVLMMEYSTYSVISPEGCASILWSDATLAGRASDKLKLTATDVQSLKIIDGIVKEPQGGAHRNWQESFESLRQALVSALEPMIQAQRKALKAGKPVDFIEERFRKFREAGNLALARTKPDNGADADEAAPQGLTADIQPGEEHAGEEHTSEAPVAKAPKASKPAVKKAATKPAARKPASGGKRARG